jgi:3'(2'), 5'-bisphosphate nucleotidase
MRREMTAQLAALAVEAGTVIMKVYGGDFTVTQKADASPMTEADHLAEQVILAGLQRLAPNIPVIAEEEAAVGRVPEIGPLFFLVDPLDGTREFISRNGEFTVNIALIAKESPQLGVVYAPAKERLFYGYAPGAAFETAVKPNLTPADWPQATPIAARRAARDGLVVVASRSHRDAKTDAYLKPLRVKEFKSAGSSLKFCLIAAGEADLYPRFGQTMEWDTAAGHAVLACAGGRVSCLDGTAFLYGKTMDGFANPAFVARGKL